MRDGWRPTERREGGRVVFGPGAAAELGPLARRLAPGRPALLVADPRLVASGAAGEIATRLAEGAGPVAVFSDFAGEPGSAAIDAAAGAARGAGAALVVGLGGGSALDIAKMAAFCAASGAAAETYAENAAPPPPRPLPKILIPTTAGAGAEASATCVFAAANGRKTWTCAPAAKPEATILDPLLTLSLPATLTAWCGLDAFVHAFEAATNRKACAVSRREGRAALALIADTLPRAVAAPDDVGARLAMLRGAWRAGRAIDAAGTAVAHMASHALAGLAPVHHGLATALAFEASLDWLAEADTPDLRAAAAALGLRRAADLAPRTRDLFDSVGLRRALPSAFAALAPEALAAEMAAPRNAPMRAATIRRVDAAVMTRLSLRLLALAAPGVDRSATDEADPPFDAQAAASAMAPDAAAGGRRTAPSGPAAAGRRPGGLNAARSR